MYILKKEHIIILTICTYSGNIKLVKRIKHFDVEFLHSLTRKESMFGDTDSWKVYLTNDFGES